MNSVVVLTTVPDAAAGAALGRALVEESLVACAQLDTSPMRSFYRWEGALQDEQEYRLVLKLLPARVAALRARLAELHPYDVPQFLALDAEASAEYLAWMRGA